MSRLTERDEFGNADIIGVDSSDLYCMMDFKETNAITFALNKLADYEDKEEQGLLIELKVPLGTPIWYLEEDFHDDTIEISCGFYDFQWIHFHKDEEFYLTKDKAEEALAKMIMEEDKYTCGSYDSGYCYQLGRPLTDEEENICEYRCYAIVENEVREAESTPV